MTTRNLTLGFYDHFYKNSCFDEMVSTHYINAPHLICIDSSKLRLPLEQHHAYRWVDIRAIKSDETIHHFSKIFLDELIIHLENQMPFMALELK